MSAALLRFWWVATLGVVVGVALAVWMLYEVPGFTPRDQPVWTAPARLFVTSSEGQYIRLSVPRVLESGTSATEPESSRPSGRGGGSPLVINEPPNVEPLLKAANFYPQLIESDDVAKLREKMFGPLRGTVTANAYTAVSTPSRFTPAQIPVVDIFASSATAKEAVTLASATVDAFQAYITAEQNRAELEPEERILIQELKAAGPTFPIGGPAYGIPILVALAVMAGFGMLAVVLDQIVPRRAHEPKPTSRPV